MKLFEFLVFVSPIEVDDIHTEALRSGGASGVIDWGRVLSAIEAPKATFEGKPLYPSLAKMAAAYVWGLARNHGFVDGNKRTALQTALTFLRLNGHAIQVGGEWVDFMVQIASDRPPNRREIVEAFVRAMGEDEEVT